MAKRIDPKNVPAQVGTFYPPPYDQPCRARERRKLGDAAGLTQFGVNLLRLPPGAWSSQRHWHKEQDEFIYIVSGEVVLVTDAGEEILKAGDCAGFKAGDVLVQFGDKPIHNLYDFTDALRRSKVGDVVDVQVLRDGKPVKAYVKLEQRK